MFLFSWLVDLLPGEVAMELVSVWVHRKIGRLTGGKTLRQCHWIDACLFIRPSVVYVTIKVEHCEWKDIFPDTFLDSFRLSDRTTSPLIFLAFRIPPRNRISQYPSIPKNIHSFNENNSKFVADVLNPKIFLTISVSEVFSSGWMLSRHGSRTPFPGIYYQHLYFLCINFIEI